jgi:hypothetical protein
MTYLDFIHLNTHSGANLRVKKGFLQLCERLAVRTSKAAVTLQKTFSLKITLEISIFTRLKMDN